jgi:hypothetical protein
MGSAYAEPLTFGPSPFDKLRVTMPFDKLRMTMPFDKLGVT